MPSEITPALKLSTEGVEAERTESSAALAAEAAELAPRALKWLLDHGADPQLATREYGNPVTMLICTYTRNAKGKNACLEVFADVGFKREGRKLLS